MGGINPTLVKLKVQRVKENKALLKGTITALIREFLKEIGKSESFDPKNDYDKDFIKMSQKFFRRSPIKINQTDQEDMILDALTKAVRSKGARKFDPSKGEIQAFLGFFFQKRLLNEIRQFQEEAYREIQEKEDTDFTREEQQEFRRQRVQPEVKKTEEIVEFKDLIKSLGKFIHDKRNVPGKGNKRLFPIFNLLLKEKSLKEIASNLKVTPQAITEDLNKLKKLVVEYAKRENNEDLRKLMVKHFKKKGSEAAKDKDWLIDVFKEYKKISGEVERSPVGEVIKVKKSEFEDKMTDEYISNALLSGEKDPKSLNSELNKFVDALELQDEILQDDSGKIVGLEIISDEIRDTK
jgi:predicted DNA-binding protein YlxM (UPF0122 family)